MMIGCLYIVLIVLIVEIFSFLNNYIDKKYSKDDN